MMEMTLTRVVSNETCQMCNTRPIAGALVIPQDGADTQVTSGCGECLGEKVKEIL